MRVLRSGDDAAPFAPIRNLLVSSGRTPPHARFSLRGKFGPPTVADSTFRSPPPSSTYYVVHYFAFSPSFTRHPPTRRSGHLRSSRLQYNRPRCYLSLCASTFLGAMSCHRGPPFGRRLMPLCACFLGEGLLSFNALQG